MMKWYELVTDQSFNSLMHELYISQSLDMFDKKALFILVSQMRW